MSALVTVPRVALSGANSKRSPCTRIKYAPGLYVLSQLFQLLVFLPHHYPRPSLASYPPMPAITFRATEGMVLGLPDEDVPAHVKRYAMYLPNAEDFARIQAEIQLDTLSQEDGDDSVLSMDNSVMSVDDASFWAANALVAFPSSQQPSEANSGPTPAQSIANRYRAGLPIGLDSALTLQAGSDTNSYDMLEEVEETFAREPSFAPLNFAVRARFCSQSLKQLATVRKESFGERGTGLREDASCSRSDFAQNSKALVFHQHMRNVYEKSWKCEPCGAFFTKRYELTDHLCTCPQALMVQDMFTSRPSPVRETFKRVLSKFTSH
ncbi:Proline racemase [Mycena indigotica]|uniref:Proline racemase n=1 Tax=Mycena indigotica TaxID=2126181 RepID=A0A8H6WBJ9_9AGAR|nr:Proline racemase [Mycena indigotica]KAF7312704.1 Proline racemase [Mycena indigotica]